ncbi:MAG: hypothetical protein E7295_08915 [Lachnospiraceae bacterium]|jgi:hypothetical protein|nr:hypothetical protein [Lachnospiraceae bacterium]
MSERGKRKLLIFPLTSRAQHDILLKVFKTMPKTAGAESARARRGVRKKRLPRRVSHHFDFMPSCLCREAFLILLSATKSKRR